MFKIKNISLLDFKITEKELHLFTNDRLRAAACNTNGGNQCVQNPLCMISIILIPVNGKTIKPAIR